MKLKENKFYIIKLNLNGRIEEYKGKVQSIEKDEFRFETENDNLCRALTLNFKDLVYSKKYTQEKKDKTFKISQKKQFKNLKKSPEPEF